MCSTRVKLSASGFLDLQISTKVTEKRYSARFK